MNSLLQMTKNGLYCPVGDFYIDPFKEVDRAIITHAHSDHARCYANNYIAHEKSIPILKKRLGENRNYTGLKYKEKISVNGVKISLFPAGHILGSAQVRLEYKKTIWGISGDYKLASDPTCEQFEPIKCNVFISESTFALPIFKWQQNTLIFKQINDWWLQNQTNQQPSLLGAYSLGKAQRILASIDNHIGPIYIHGAINNLLPCYQTAKIRLPPVHTVDLREKNHDYNQALILAPPSAINSTWAQRFKNAHKALASGWMTIRGNKRIRGLQHGFVLSDHADWHSILTAIKNTQAEKIIITHGYKDTLKKYLTELGYDAQSLT